MIEKTMDPTTWITNRTVENDENVLYYENTDGKKWKIKGSCIACGLCENHVSDEGSIAIITNKIINSNNEIETYTRELNWVGIAGTPGACIETNFQNRLDIPMTPDFVNEIDGCTLSGEWIDAD
jgi:hypothetical protein